jgi:microcystin-dependent protein
MAYLGEIRIFGGTYAPKGWAMCEGQIVPISEYEELFNLIGITYGGDGQSTFALPDLRGRVPVHKGEGPEITDKYPIGSMGGEEEVVLTEQQLPVHKHAFQASEGPGASSNPQGNVIGSPPAVSLFGGRRKADLDLPSQMVGPTEGAQPHENRMPYLALTYIICVVSKIIPTPTST